VALPLPSLALPD
jgi:hypothetical protein